MLDKKPEMLTSMRMYSGVREMEHSYEHDYSSKDELNFAVELLDDEEKELRELLAAFPGFSLEAIAAAYTEASADVNAAAEVLATRQPVVEVVQCAGLQEGRKCSISNTIDKCRGMQPLEDSLMEPDDLLSLRYGTGVGKCISQNVNQQVRNLGEDTCIENKNSHSLTCATIEGTSSEICSMRTKENYGVSGEGMPGKGEKKKKKRRVGAEIEQLEPKDAVARRSVEEFLLSMLGEGFQLGQDVVRDVLGSAQAGLQSLEMLLHMASTTSGLGSSSDHKGTDLKKSSLIVDAELKAMEDSLRTLMGAFPNVDHARIVKALQEHNGDVEKVSTAVLLDGQVEPNLRSQQEEMSEVDCSHPDRRVMHAQLKRLFPVVDNNFLWEVLKSTNFVLRGAHQVLSDAGLTPTIEHSKRNVRLEDNQRKLTPSAVKNLQKAGGKEVITAEPHALQDMWVDVKPVVTPGRIKSTPRVVKGGGSSIRDGGKKKIAVQCQTHGFNDYNCYRHDAKENWSTMQNYFREAASAYSRGERSYANVLSEKGKYYKRLAQEADERASLRTFVAKNKNIENNITIDLHAQHVSEALQVFKLHLRSLSRILSVHTLTVITGYGSSSSDGRGKIKSAVTSFLRRRGIPWKETNVGCIVIMLKDARNKILKSAEDGSSSECD